MAQIRVSLKPSERAALRQLASRERRDPRDQAAIIVVRELQRAGLLPEQAVKAAGPAPVEEPADVA
jgi:hypothetical protein